VPAIVGERERGDWHREKDTEKGKIRTKTRSGVLKDFQRVDSNHFQGVPYSKRGAGEKVHGCRTSDMTGKQGKREENHFPRMGQEGDPSEETHPQGLGDTLVRLHHS